MMGEFFVAVVAAFVIFMVVLPAVGILAGLFFRVVLPYAAGVMGSMVIAGLVAGGEFAAGIALVLSGAWLIGVWTSRQIFQTQRGKPLEWHAGHYLGAVLCLSCCAPLWKGGEVEAEVELKECQAET